MTTQFKKFASCLWEVLKSLTTGNGAGDVSLAKLQEVASLAAPGKAAQGLFNALLLTVEPLPYESTAKAFNEAYSATLSLIKQLEAGKSPEALKETWDTLSNTLRRVSKESNLFLQIALSFADFADEAEKATRRAA